MARNLSELMDAGSDRPLGERLSQARRLYGLSVWRDVSPPDVAALIGVQPETYWRYEAGKRIPPSPTRIALAKVLGVPVSYFELAPNAADSEVKPEMKQEGPLQTAEEFFGGVAKRRRSK